MTSSRRLIIASLCGALLLLGLTSIHHIYGARIFGTPWRAHMAHTAALIASGLLLCLAISRWVEALRRWALWAFCLLTLTLVVGWIGLFEGGYNHFLKVILYTLQLPQSLLLRMYPPPMYEPPVDLWFEITGILQFPLGVWVAAQCLALVRRLLRDETP